MLATHEVADCGASEVVAPCDAKWEACVIKKTKRDTYDVQIIEDGTIVPNVPKRFVRPVTNADTSTLTPKSKRKRYGWSDAELSYLVKAKRARLEALERGEPASQRNSWIKKYLVKHAGMIMRCAVRAIQTHLTSHNSQLHITTCSTKSIYRALKKLDPNTSASTTPETSPDLSSPERDLTLGERARVRQMLGDKPLRRGDRLLANIAAKLGVSPKSVWRSYRTALPRASSSQ